MASHLEGATPADRIPSREYLDHALSLREDEAVRLAAVLKEIPDEVIDAHVHTNLVEHVAPLLPRTVQMPYSSFPGYDIATSQEIHRHLFGGKVVHAVRFPHAFREVDHRRATDYLLEAAPSTDRVAAYGLVNDLEYTDYALKDPRISALKMYYHDVDPPAKRIYEYFRPEICEMAQAVDKPLILHLPAPLARSIDDLLTVARDFSRLRLVLAHMGLTHLPDPQYDEALERVRPLEQISFDTARVLSSEVFEAALRAVGPTRVLFGSDEPLHLLRTTPYRHPVHGTRVAANYPYHWLDPEESQEFGHLAARAPLAHIVELESIVDAVGRVQSQPQGALEQVFSGNAREIFGFDTIRRDLRSEPSLDSADLDFGSR